MSKPDTTSLTATHRLEGMTWQEAMTDLRTWMRKNHDDHDILNITIRPFEGNDADEDRWYVEIETLVTIGEYQPEISGGRRDIVERVNARYEAMLERERRLVNQ